MTVAAKLFTFRSLSLYRCTDQDVKVWVVVFGFFPPSFTLFTSKYIYQFFRLGQNSFV